MKRQATTETTRSPHQQTKQWCRSQRQLLRQARRRDGHSWRNSRRLKKGSKRNNGRRDYYVPRSSRNAPRAVHAREAGRLAQERILVDDNVDNPLDLKRDSQKLVAEAYLLQAMPEPSMTKGRNLCNEARVLIEQAAV